ncbi:hypothetical protein [Candidatus Pseudoruminococcus sp.]|uniref:hypothetical protein n=1 Tax=Candidatus Pseudoruminococcus sp. TaxID=3101048 RepID=UPI00399B7154
MAAANDLKNMAKQTLEKNKIFFDEAVSKMEDLRFYASRFGGSCDDLLLKQIDLYISELQQLKKSISGTTANEH